jgi:hypothetical protein
VGGVRFVNDSKATNVEAARRSIESFDRGVVAIVGGRFKGGDLRALREPLAARGRGAIAIGESASLVREALSGAVPVIEASSMREAVERGFEAAAGARVFELRLVPRLRGSRRSVQGRGRSVTEGAGRAEHKDAGAGAVSCRQSVRAGGNPPLGTRSTPDREVGVPFHEPADDC